MKPCDTYSHLNALEIIKNRGVYLEIHNCMNQESVLIEKGNPLYINKSIEDYFNSMGWADDIKLKNSKLSINFLKSRVGVCVQFGNVARMYADILKLGYLFNEEIIDAGVICVPHQIESKMLGANYARFDRLRTEIKLFHKIINVPILVIGLSN